MMQAGTLMVGYQPDDRRPNFFRSIISSAAVTEKDVDFVNTLSSRQTTVAEAYYSSIT